MPFKARTNKDTSILTLGNKQTPVAQGTLLDVYIVREEISDVTADPGGADIDGAIFNTDYDRI